VGGAVLPGFAEVPGADLGEIIEADVLR